MRYELSDYEWTASQHSTEMESQRPNLLQPVSRARNLIERFFNKIK
jgi:hypothetical protein